MAMRACVRRTLLISYCGEADRLIWQASLLLLLQQLLAAACQLAVPSTVSVGSYLPPQGSTNPVGLASPNGMYNLRIEAWTASPALLCMAAVTNTKIGTNNAMLWAANNAQPLEVSSTCRLFLSSRGDLLLQYDGSNTAWQTQTAGMGVSNLTLHNSGNLVLHTEEGRIIWQSFTQSPAFAWNSGMNLTSSITIFSPDTVGDVQFNVPGSFALQLHNHSSLVLFTNSNDSFSRFVYWSSSGLSLQHATAHTDPAQVSYVVSADDGFTFYDNSSQSLGSIPPTTVLPASNYSSALRIALLHPQTANLAAFYRSDVDWVLYYNSSISACQTPTHCGNFGLCNASTTACTCPPGFLQSSAHRDCEPESNISFPPPSSTCSPSDVVGSLPEKSYYSFVAVNVSFPPQLDPLSSPSVANCTSICKLSCVCRVALFDSDTRSCSLFSSLPTLPLSTESKQVMLLKFIKERHSSKKHLAPIIGAVCAACAASLCLICTMLAFCRTKRRENRKASSKGAPHEEGFLQALPRLPPRYTYKELEEATKSFSTMLGAGGFGSVYEGVLQSGVKVAVKKLEVSGQSSVQFKAEVASIGCVSHVNLVKLKGFCQEGDWRLLVYEHMGGGSLDRWLFKGGEEKGKQLGWQRRCKIASDTAMGLAYLHHECGERIVHCDVKPENILLDEEFNAKVGDFGLAKLVGNDQQGFTLTTVKGTRGYMAPEWLQDATITSKSDVYSFGIVFLELISGRRCLHTNHGYLPTLAFRIVSSSLARSSNRLIRQGRSEASALSASSDKGSFLSQSSTSHGKMTERQSDECDEQALIASSHFYSDASVPNEKPSQPTSPSHSQCQTENDDAWGDMASLLDPHLSADADVSATSLERMIFIALWCVQPNPAARPSMSVVLQMMEGIVDTPVPPLQRPPLDVNSAFASSSEALFSSSR